MVRTSSRITALAAACAAAIGLSLTLAASAPATAAAPAGATTPPRHYTAEEVHHFLEGFYGNHGPRPWEREHLVTEELKKRAAETPGFDLLLCAQNTPKDISVGEVTTAQSAGMGWATVTTTWGAGPKQKFTAYVGLDATAPAKLTEISCPAA